MTARPRTSARPTGLPSSPSRRNGIGLWSPSGVTWNAESRSSNESSAAAAGSSQSPISASASANLPLRISFSFAAHDPHARAGREPHAPQTAKVAGDDVPRRGPVDLGEARPARRLVETGGLHGAPRHADVSDTPADALGRIDRIRQPAEPHHVAALSIVRVGMEEVVGDVFH